MFLLSVHLYLPLGNKIAVILTDQRKDGNMNDYHLHSSGVLALLCSYSTGQIRGICTEYLMGKSTLHAS